MRRIAILAIILSGLTKIQAQDVVFSQFYNTTLYLNPAFAGISGGPRLTALYRNQWPLLGNAYSTYLVSYDQFLNQINSGVGAIVSSDVQGGFYYTNSITGMYAYQIQLNENWAINVGLQAAFMQKRIQTDKLVFAENINLGNGSVNNFPSKDIPDNPTRSFADFGAGALFFSKKVFIGFAAKHLSQPNESFDNTLPEHLPICYDANAGIELRSGNYSSSSFFSPNIMYAQQEFFKQATGGFITGINVFYAGLYYRYAFGKNNAASVQSDSIKASNSSAFILLAGLQKGIFKIGYSYDITLGGLSGTGGSHEISVTLNFNDSKKSREKNQRKKLTECPKMF
ncbi:MAG: PorP/SprF family type IX secretion system membrane protein [Chitinophagales bacterium]|nr:PorP/SprF family type IX secretion system membrane protein [Chitinophagales bacterium]